MKVASIAYQSRGRIYIRSLSWRKFEPSVSSTFLFRQAGNQKSERKISHSLAPIAVSPGLTSYAGSDA